MATIEESWNRIHRWMEDNSPDMLRLLKPGVTQSVMNKLKADIQVNVFPKDFELSYITHNGSTATNFFGSNIAFSFYTTEDILKEWNSLKESHAPKQDKAPLEREAVANPKIKKLIWSERWIPFGGDNHGNCICIDLDPSATGTYGQVIHWFFNGESPTLCASSFANYLEGFAEDISKGKYRLAQDDRKLIYIGLDNDS